MQESKRDINIIFFGSSDFSCPILVKLIEKFEVLLVITEPDQPAGRKKIPSPTPIKLIAGKYNIACFQPEKIKSNQELLLKIKDLKPDLIVVASYGKILPAEFLDLPKYKCINAHPSLLPKYRGASPIQSALLNGDEITGVSLIKMNDKMDEGDIIVQKEVRINVGDHYLALEKRLAEFSANLIVESIPKYINGESSLTVQDDSSASYCTKITKEDGKINWQDTALSIYNKIRAFAKWPGSYADFNGKKLDIIEAELSDLERDNLMAGTVFQQVNNIYVKCGDGCLLIKKIKIEGKKETDVKNFINGYRDFVGAVLK